MVDVVSRNTIKLSGTASSVQNYYVGYSIILTRYNTSTGKQLVQKKEIVAYDGANRLATIDGIWDADFIPASTDTYKIVPTYPDSRVSTNPAMQTLDYISSQRYGKGLNPQVDLYLPSWLESGRICDTQSDVTVELHAGVTAPGIGDVYRYPQSGTLLFQGTVKSINGQYVRFTSVLGKLSNKWNSWKSYPANSYIYDDNRLYRATAAGVKFTRPTHNAGNINGLEYDANPMLYKVSGSGLAQLPLVKSDGNPVRSVNAAGIKISGYSLYDSDGIDYWRYVGWDEHSQRNVTRHQTNLIIDTSIPLFDNINSLLDHFGGILRYTAGQYHLEVEAGEGSIPATSTEPRNLSADTITGKIKISDDGVKSSFNSLTVAYADPGNKFEAKNISFFNSDFMKADRNVSKKGNVSIPGITNYYNARLLADKFLAKSRYGMTISMNIIPQGILLLAGKVIQVQHPRYGWQNKKFRIENITHNPDTSVDIVAKEYDDSMYIISNVSRPPAAALAAEAATNTTLRPSGLRATSIDSNDEGVSGIELNWDPPTKSDNTVSTDIFGSHNPRLFVIVDTITNGRTFSTSSPHGLVEGDVVTSNSSTNGLQYGKSYYIKSVPSDSSFTLTETLDGIEIGGFDNGIQLQLKILTATVIATVPPPSTSYVDIVSGAQTERVEKYYWIRYRINKQ